MPEASPAKWHLAHTTWFFETFVLEKYEKGFKPFHTLFRMLFNSYYEAVGPQYPRPARGLMTRPSLQEVFDYRSHVDEKILQLLGSSLSEQSEFISRIEWGLQHEQQHQELILSDIKHLFFQNPLRPAIRPPSSSRDHSPHNVTVLQKSDWLEHPGGLIEIGAEAQGFCFDNELPRHSYWLEPFYLSPQLVTNQEFLHFIDDGGYKDPRLWLSEGWAESIRLKQQHPLYWQKIDDQWFEFSFEGNQPINLQAPLIHVSYFEADAFARWAGYHLPSEFEWEAMVRREGLVSLDELKTNEDQISYHPDPQENTGYPGFFRIGWQWTHSSYGPYPGYRPLEGALGEYNGKFMVNQQVLRGGSCVTPMSHLRASYRNFYPASSRWAFSAIRLAS